MRHFGEGMSAAGFPFGVPLVWFMISWQVLCSTLIATRCLVVPACIGHIFVLGTGIVIIHYPDWFIVGPGEGGMEFPHRLHRLLRRLHPRLLAVATGRRDERAIDATVTRYAWLPLVLTA